MSKIIILVCYFGKFPWYFSLFLKSCSYNTMVDFFIFSDCDNFPNLPKNVKIIPFSLKAFNELATEKLGFFIDLKYAYKLCDFKPAYGIIFSDYLKGYDFWGMTDIDIVFGRIREFMTEDLLNTYDAISVRNDYPTGSFMLFRNEEITNNLFKKSKDYKKVFQSDKHYCFDECNFKHDFLQAGGAIENIECEVDSMHHVMMREMKKQTIKIHFDFLVIEGLPGQLKWENGLLSFKNEFEVLLYHLILYKANKYSRKKKWATIPDKFYIDKYTIRKNDLKSFKGKVHYYHDEKLLPYIKKAIFQMDFFISKRMGYKVKTLNDGVFKIGNLELKIVKNKNNCNEMIFYNSNFKMIKSMLCKDAFFIKSFPLKRYQYDIVKHQIKTLSLNGTTQSFDEQIK